MTSRVRPRWTVLILCLAAFAIRVWNLDAQSLWHDEAGSLRHAAQPLDAILRGVEPQHLPYWFLGLKGWVALAGDGEVAVRFPAVVASTLSVVLLWWTGRTIAGTTVGVLAALVGTVAPSLIYYGQEVRMYIWLPVFALVAIGSIVRADRGWWIPHGLALAASLMTHYYGALTIVLAATLIVTRRRQFRQWLFSLGIVVALVGPWILTRLGQIAGVGSTSAADLTPLALIWRSAVGVLLGQHLERVTLVLNDGLANDDYRLAAWLLAPLVLLLAIGLWPRRRDGGATILLAFFVPLVAVGLFSIGQRDFGSRYLMAGAAGWYLALALGLARIFRWQPVAGLVAVMAVVVVSGLSYQRYLDPAYAREDNRALVQYVSALAEPGDAIVMNAGYNDVAFGYYYRGSMPRFAEPSTYPPDDRRTVAELEWLAGQYDRLWLMLWQDYYSDPRGTVKGWLDANGVQIDAQVFHGLTLYRYLSKPPLYETLPVVDRPTPATLGGQVRFHGADVRVNSVDGAAAVQTRLYWQPLRPLSTSYRVSVELINPLYQVAGQKDNRPVFDRYETTRWRIDQIVGDDYRIAVAPGTPPGEYQLAIAMYDAATGRRLPVDGTDRDYLLVGPVTIPRLSTVPTPEARLGVRFGDGIELVGFDGVGTVTSGGNLAVTYYWRSITPAPPATVFNHVLDSSGTLVAQKDSTPAGGTYPTDRWTPGEYVRDRYDIPLPADLPAGRYTLRTGIYLADGSRLAASGGSADRSVQVTTFEIRP